MELNSSPKWTAVQTDAKEASSKIQTRYQVPLQATLFRLKTSDGSSIVRRVRQQTNADRCLMIILIFLLPTNEPLSSHSKPGFPWSAVAPNRKTKIKWFDYLNYHFEVSTENTTSQLPTGIPHRSLSFFKRVKLELLWRNIGGTLIERDLKFIVSVLPPCGYAPALVAAKFWRGIRTINYCPKSVTTWRRNR